MKCAWCNEPAVGDEVIVEPAVYKMVQGVKAPVQHAKTAPACPLHHGITERQPPPCPVKRRRRPGPEQTTIFDMGL